MEGSQPPQKRSPAPLEYETVPNGIGETRRLPEWATFILGAIGVFALLFFVLTALGLFLASRQDRRTTPRELCSANLDRIASAMTSYASTHNGSYPADFGELFSDPYTTPAMFICPSSHDTPVTGTPQQQVASLSAPGHCSYIYLGKGLTINASPDTVLAYEPLSNHTKGINVLFANQHRLWLPAAEAQKMINAIVPGTPMIWPPRAETQP